ncbi:MAG: LemA family protein [Bacilli bacterium]|nr:LemA family protein [Bacilli bacterium]
MGIGLGVLFVILIIVLISWVIKCYNGLVQLRNKVKNAFSQIDVQLKKRFDLIPNLVETVKGYAKIEEGIFTEFAKARGLYQSASSKGDVEGLAEATQSLGGVVSRLLMVTEQYPNLKSDAQFINLQNQLQETEKQIAYSRQFYNDIVLKYNDKTEMFPSNIIAGMFKFEQAKFFEITKEEQREAPQVKF